MVLGVILLSSLVSCNSVVSAPPVVATSLGPVAGKIMHDHAKAFLGIPFAADTGGSRRFMPPAPRTPWESVRQAVDFAPGCVQAGDQKGAGADNPPNQSEDCLNNKPPGGRTKW